MANRQIDVNQLDQAKANVALTQELLTQAIEKSNSDPSLSEEAIKQASQAIAQAQTAVSQVQSAIKTQQQEQQKSK